MKKRITALLLGFLWILPAQAGAASVGEVVGHVYSTDITAYVDGMLIPSYNIGGKIAIIAENLMDYGFEVVWDEEGRIATLEVLRRGSFVEVDGNRYQISKMDSFLALL